MLDVTHPGRGPSSTANRSGAGFAWPRKVPLLGVGVSVTDYEQAAAILVEAARRGESAIVSCQAVHAVVTASASAEMRAMVNGFDLVAPDGQPVRWAMNALHHTRLTERVYGPELMLRACRVAAEAGVSIYLYGSSPDVLVRLRRALKGRFPTLHVAGIESPPFRDLTAAEVDTTVARIKESGARIVFVGLGCPRQDIFAHAHRDAIGAVLVCVGAAFDFHAGTKRMAPPWMQRRGLEWLFRLSQEPRRLWRRYLITNAVFLGKLTLELVKLRLLQQRVA